MTSVLTSSSQLQTTTVYTGFPRPPSITLPHLGSSTVARPWPAKASQQIRCVVQDDIKLGIPNVPTALPATSSAIWQAANRGDLPSLQNAITLAEQRGPAVLKHEMEWKDTVGRTPLIEAAKYNHVSCVRELLCRGANPLHVALLGTAMDYTSHPEIREMLHLAMAGAGPEQHAATAPGYSSTQQSQSYYPSNAGQSMRNRNLINNNNNGSGSEGQRRQSSGQNRHSEDYHADNMTRELQAKNQQGGKNQQGNPASRGLCRFWQKGTCRYADACWFIHQLPATSGIVSKVSTSQSASVAAQASEPMYWPSAAHNTSPQQQQQQQSMQQQIQRTNSQQQLRQPYNQQLELRPLGQQCQSQNASLSQSQLQAADRNQLQFHQQLKHAQQLHLQQQQQQTLASSQYGVSSLSASVLHSRSQSFGGGGGGTGTSYSALTLPRNAHRSVCRYWLQGICNRGPACRFLHGSAAPAAIGAAAAAMAERNAMSAARPRPRPRSAPYIQTLPPSMDLDLSSPPLPRNTSGSLSQQQHQQQQLQQQRLRHYSHPGLLLPSDTFMAAPHLSPRSGRPRANSVYDALLLGSVPTSSPVPRLTETSSIDSFALPFDLDEYDDFSEDLHLGLHSSNQSLLGVLSNPSSSSVNASQLNNNSQHYHTEVLHLGRTGKQSSPPFHSFLDHPNSGSNNDSRASYPFTTSVDFMSEHELRQLVGQQPSSSSVGLEMQHLNTEKLWADDSWNAGLASSLGRLTL